MVFNVCKRDISNKLNAFYVVRMMLKQIAKKYPIEAIDFHDKEN